MRERKVIISESQFSRLMKNIHDHRRSVGVNTPRKMPIPKGWELVGNGVYEDKEGNLFVLFPDGKFQLVEEY